MRKHHRSAKATWPARSENRRHDRPGKGLEK
jgi:hypothetical protein